MLCRAMRGVPTGPPYPSSGLENGDFSRVIRNLRRPAARPLAYRHTDLPTFESRGDKGNDGALSASIARGRSSSRQRQLVMTNRQRPAQTTCLRCCNFGFSAVLPVFTIASHLDLSEARSLMRCWRIRTGHRADRLGWLSDRVLPDLRLQVGLGLNPAPSSLKF
jgi:hypothetical protein